jgi:hypothetical protein
MGFDSFVLSQYNVFGYGAIWDGSKTCKTHHDIVLQTTSFTIFQAFKDYVQ